MKANKRRPSVLLPLTALVLPLVLAGAVLAVDVARVCVMKRQMRAAADTAARATVEGWQNDSKAALGDPPGRDEQGAIEIHVPPTRGFNAGDPQFVEAVVRKQAPLYSLRILSKEAPWVETRAVVSLLPPQAGARQATSTADDVRG